MAVLAKVGTVSGFIKAVKGCVLSWGIKGPFWFRGQAQSWALLPKLLRFQNPDEVALRVDFERLGMELLSGARPPVNHWEWYFLAQHFGLPTRLLDWTESALFALYFAVREHESPDKIQDAVVWMLDPKWLNSRSGREPEIVVPGPPFNDWLPENPGTPVKAKSALAIAPPHVARRVAVQRSQFVLFGTDPTALSEAERIPKGKLVRIEIAGGAVPQLLDELQLLGIWETTLFPDLEGLSRELELKFAGPKR